MVRSIIISVVLMLLLAGCEPERGIRANRDFQSSLDVACMDGALRDAFGAVERWDYVSDGGTFPEGTRVAQMAYHKWDDGVGWTTLHVGSLGQRTRISHAFTGIGSELPQASFPPAIRAMAQAGEALQNACGVDLAGMEFQAIGQDVDALN